MIYILITVVILFLVNLGTANQFYKIASMKGHSDKQYFWWCFFLGIVGWLMVVALPDRAVTKTESHATSSELPDL